MCSGIGRHCYQNRAVGHLLAFVDGDRFDFCVEGGLELVLDLHRLEHDQGLAARDAVARRHVDGDDAAVHRCAKLAVAAGVEFLSLKLPGSPARSTTMSSPSM